MSDKHKSGAIDCANGLEPQSSDPMYLAGYSQQYEIEQIEGANHG